MTSHDQTLARKLQRLKSPDLFFESHPIYREECGVFGIWNSDDAAAYVALGLHALQHRGQEATGIVSYQEPHFHAHRAKGRVGDSFSDPDVIRALKGRSAIGHNRYSTTGASTLDNIQPLFAEMEFGGCAVAHNGNFTNALEIRRNLIQKGSVFSSTGDTESLIHLMSTSSGSIRERILQALNTVTGAFALIMLTEDALIGARDPWGIRPLVLGKLGESYILASETCALNMIGADFIREIERGEVVFISQDQQQKCQIHSIIMENRQPYTRPCLFEYVYFSRPDSSFDGRPIYTTRCQIGKELAIEHGIEADLVVPIPDSGNPAAIGLARELNIPFDLGIVRNHYVGRTFIEPSSHIRGLGVRLKHSPNVDAVKGKRIILVDDSLVRGTTSRKIIPFLREAGVAAIHLRIASPPVRFPCFYGINISPTDDLPAAESHQKDFISQLSKHLGVDSLAYLSLDGLYRALGVPERDPKNPAFTDHFFSGDYPTALYDFDNNLTSSTDTALLQRVPPPAPNT